MSRHVVKSISEQYSKKPQISLPVSNENIVHLDRRLRSDKPDVHYFITSPLPPRDLGAEFAQPTALTVTPNSTFGAVGGQEQIIESPHRVEGEEEEEDIPEEESEEEEDEVFVPPPQPFIAPPVGVRWGIWITLPRLAQKQDGGRRVPVSECLLTRHLATVCVHSNHPTSSIE